VALRAVEEADVDIGAPRAGARANAFCMIAA
jgi:hypothetical protein